MTTSKISKVQAQILWTDLRNCLVNAGTTIEKIVQARAWEPMGYPSFSEAWAAQMSNILLAKEIRAHVVYQMLADGLDTEDITDLVKGIGPDAAQQLARQRENGVPADYAVVNKHLRRKPTAPDTIHIKVGSTMLSEYRRVAAQKGFSVEDVARQAIAERFREIVSAKARIKRSA